MTDTHSRDARVHKILEETFSPKSLLLENHSSRHAGHNPLASANGDTHYKIVIKSDKFSHKSRVESHRMIMNALAEEFKTGLHALEIIAS